MWARHVRSTRTICSHSSFSCSQTDCKTRDGLSLVRSGRGGKNSLETRDSAHFPPSVALAVFLLLLSPSGRSASCISGSAGSGWMLCMKSQAALAVRHRHMPQPATCGAGRRASVSPAQEAYADYGKHRAKCKATPRGARGGSVKCDDINGMLELEVLALSCSRSLSIPRFGARRTCAPLRLVDCCCYYAPPSPHRKYKNLHPLLSQARRSSPPASALDLLLEPTTTSNLPLHALHALR